MQNNIKTSIRYLSTSDDISADWKDLERRSDCSFFLTWSWIGNWLRLTPDTGRPIVLSVYDADKLIALAVFFEKDIRRNRLFKLNVLSLHEFGLPSLNMVIEHNGFLVDKDYEVVGNEALFRFLKEDVASWDEINISAAGESFFDSAKRLFVDDGYRYDYTLMSESRFVNLGEYISDPELYLASLSSNTRYQIRKSIKSLSSEGAVEISIASSVEEAFEYFSRLRYLHQKSWEEKGKSGSFANPNWVNFHTQLISDAFNTGSIQMVRILAGEVEVGYLYNFVHNNCVSMIQSGLNYELGKKVHPGYVCHYLAITENITLGNSVYDFLAGDSQYKRSLATDSSKLAWVTLQRRSCALRLEGFLKSIYRKALGKPSNIEF